MSVKMNDEDIIKRFHTVVGYGRVIKRKPYLHHDPMWEWRLTRTNDILKLSKKFLPFMGLRRTKQILTATKGKVPVKKRQVLKIVPECGYMKPDEISNRGAHKHVRVGEKPCPTCAENQHKYLRQWRKAFFEANK